MIGLLLKPSSNKPRLLGFPISNWSKTLTSEVFKCPFFSVSLSTLNFSSFKKDYYVINFGPRSGVVVVKDDKILLTSQYRQLIDDLSLEIPGGKVEAGETFQAGAIRECIEEVGILCKSLEMVCEYYPGLDNVNNQTKIFFCNDFDSSPDFTYNLDEVVGISWVHIDECLEMISSQKILDCMTITGILAVKSRYF